MSEIKLRERNAILQSLRAGVVRVLAAPYSGRTERRSVSSAQRFEQIEQDGATIRCCRHRTLVQGRVSFLICFASWPWNGSSLFSST